MAFRPLESPNLSDEIQKQIRLYILDNGLTSGDRLPTETELSEQLRVSRSAVREALKAMEALGIIEVRIGTGRFIKEISLDTIFENLAYTILLSRKSIKELLEVRETLETGFMEKALARIADPELEHMRALLQVMQAKADAGSSFFEEDIEFHRTIFVATGNQLLLKLLDVFMLVYGRLRGTLFPVASDPLHEVKVHQAIFEAVQARDVERARQLIQRHFASIKARVPAANASSAEEPVGVQHVAPAPRE